MTSRLPVLAFLLAISTAAYADTFTWTCQSGNFSAPASWLVPAPTPGGSSADQLIFPDSTTVYTATLDSSSWTLNCLTMSSSATIDGSPSAVLLFDGPNPTILATDPDSNPHTINTAITSTSNLAIIGSQFTLTGPLTFLNPSAQLNITGDLTYQNNTSPIGLCTTTVTGPQPYYPNASLTWNYTITTQAPPSLTFGSGPIILNNAVFQLNIDSIITNPPASIDFTNPIVVQGNSQIGANYLQLIPPAAGSPAATTVRFTGPIRLNGSLNINTSQNPLDITGDITLDQSNDQQPSISAFIYLNPVTISGNIVDDPNHTGTQALWLGAETAYGPNPAFTIAGPNNTYSEGTVIDGDHVFVAPNSRLGTGPVSIIWGTLHFSALTNIAANQKVLVGPYGALAISFDADPSSIIDPASSGMLALDIDFSTPLNLATLGNGQMSLGSVDNSTYTADSLAPGIDGVYRFSIASDAAYYNTTLTILHSVLIDYNKKPSSSMLSGVTLAAPNSYSGGTTITGIVHADSPGALGSGNVSIGQSGLYISPYTTLFLSTANAYAPTAQVDVYATLAAVGPNGALPFSNSAPILHPGSTLQLGDNLNNNSDRYPDSLPIALNSSTLLIQATGITNEIVGPLSFIGASSLTFENPATGSHATTLITPSLTHAANSVLFVTLINASFDPTDPSYANLIIATPPTVTNGMLPPAYQLRNFDEQSPTPPSPAQPSFLTYKPNGFALPAYITLPTDGGSGTEIVDLTGADNNVIIPTPPPANPASTIPASPADPSDPNLAQILFNLLNPNPGPAYNAVALSTDTQIYALRTSTSIVNPSSGPVTLHIASGGLIAFGADNILIETNVNFDSAEAILNIGAPTEISGQITAAHGFTKVGTGSLNLSNSENQITGVIAIDGGTLTLNTLPEPTSSNPILISSNGTLAFTNTTILSRPVQAISGGVAITIPSGKTLTIAAPITGDASTTLQSGNIIIAAPITLSNNLYIQVDQSQLSANISCTNLDLAGRITGAATISAPTGVFISSGELDPGNNPGDIAAFTLNGSPFEIGQATTLNFDLDSSGHSDQLLINGNFEIDPDADGTLSLNFLAPPTGLTYTLITADSITGTFSQVTGLPDGYALDYTPTTLLLTPDADFPDIATPEPTPLAPLTLAALLLLKKRPLKNPPPLGATPCPGKDATHPPSQLPSPPAHYFRSSLLPHLCGRRTNLP